MIDFSTRLIRGTSGPWVGSLNYQLVFDDPTFRAAAKHSALLLLAVPVLLVISIVVSVLLYERVRGWRIYRSVLFIPYILAVPIVGIVASYIFALNGVAQRDPARDRPRRPGARLARQRDARALDGR